VIVVANSHIKNFGYATFSLELVPITSLMATLAARATAAKLLADEGDAAVQFVYGVCLPEGDGVDIDTVHTCEYFKQPGAEAI
jgi:hypothetical protein